MRIHGGSIFVEFVETPHPRIYIINVIVSKTVIEHFDKKRKKWFARFPNNQAYMYRINSANIRQLPTFLKPLLISSLRHEIVVDNDPIGM